MLNRLVLKKVTGDKLWTIILILILTAGLTSWIVVPSASNSLRDGLISYGENTSTYIAINPCNVDYTRGPFGENASLPKNLQSKILSLPGVQAVYPIAVNYSDIRLTGVNASFPGSPPMKVNITVEIPSAVIGGKYGFPENLILLTEGHIPQGDEPAFVLNGNTGGIFNNSGYRTFMIGSSKWNSTKAVKFNATRAGVSALNPLTSQVQILWNRTLIEDKLGPKLFNSTFGTPDFMIIRVKTINDVEQVVNQTRAALGNDQRFCVDYDQAGLIAIKSLEAQSIPLYQLLQFGSLAVTVAVVFLISYLGASRRKWEAGLLISQGWTWKRYSLFIISYYTILALVSSALSGIASAVIEHFMLYHYNFYGSTIEIATKIDPLYLLSAIPLSLAVSALAAYILTSRLRREGLDSILREY